LDIDIGSKAAACSTPVKYLVIRAGHMMHLQKGYLLFQHEVMSFFTAS
jgi:hypothetical protein